MLNFKIILCALSTFIVGCTNIPTPTNVPVRHLRHEIYRKPASIVEVKTIWDSKTLTEHRIYQLLEPVYGEDGTYIQANSKIDTIALFRGSPFRTVRLIKRPWSNTWTPAHGVVMLESLTVKFHNVTIPGKVYSVDYLEYDGYIK